MSVSETTYWPYCEVCRTHFSFHPEEPFAFCGCGITEWGSPRPAAWIPSPVASISPNRLNVMATFAHAVLCGAYRPEELQDAAKKALERTGLLSLDDVVALQTGDEPAPVKLKDHQIAQTVNALAETCRNYGHTQQLRERVAGIVVPLLKNCYIS